MGANFQVLRRALAFRRGFFVVVALLPKHMLFMIFNFFPQFLLTVVPSFTNIYTIDNHIFFLLLI